MPTPPFTHNSPPPLSLSLSLCVFVCVCFSLPCDASSSNTYTYVASGPVNLEFADGTVISNNDWIGGDGHFE